MTDTRNDIRVHSSEKCELNLDGSIHQCRIDNVSASGALVNCLGFLRETWPGDRCALSDQSGEHLCHVSHIAASRIGVHFDD